MFDGASKHVFGARGSRSVSFARGPKYRIERHPDVAFDRAIAADRFAHSSEPSTQSAVGFIETFAQPHHLPLSGDFLNPLPPCQTCTMSNSLALDPDFFDLLADSHLRLTGASLLDPAVPHADGPRWLYEDAPFCVLAHDTAEDPRYIYANKTVQRCFEYSWDEMTALHSRLSAEHPNREERARLLESVRTRGFATGYRGLRISKSGRRFWIEDVTVWNLIDRDGTYRGQAATYRRWTDV
ncbi:MEKHLA domain [Burkholderia oklahomensis]|nr:MEKHLA domain [Burkholderia oklahomensis]